MNQGESIRRKNGEDRPEFKAGDIVKVVSGKYSEYFVEILEVDRSRETARVILAVFGGLSSVPFDIKLSTLSPDKVAPMP